MKISRNIFAKQSGVIAAGAVIGILAVLLQKFGNPGNMGICVACFTRDIAGSLGLHRTAAVQYLRPEIFGIILGAFITALIFSEFKPRAGTSSMIKFFLGAFAMIGALVFLGCPWRLSLRLAAGDGQALFGLAGLVSGIWAGTRFFAFGYNPGTWSKAKPSTGLLLPFFITGILILSFVYPPLKEQAKNGLFFYSIAGPGSMHAPILVSLIFGMIIGFFLQRSRFCTIGGIRDFLLFKQTHLLTGVISLIIFAFIMNIVFGYFKPGFINQPIAHSEVIWNFLGMMLAGLSFTLAGGCPGRQLVLAGEGDGDAGVFFLGMLSGAGYAHNFMLAATPQGVSLNGKIAVITGLIIVPLIAWGMREE
ncbi:MAG: YedE family putative selenium transporter [Candidatus Omnitrophota bacterium]